MRRRSYLALQMPKVLRLCETPARSALVLPARHAALLQTRLRPVSANVHARFTRDKRIRIPISGGATCSTTRVAIGGLEITARLPPPPSVICRLVKGATCGHPADAIRDQARLKGTFLGYRGPVWPRTGQDRVPDLKDEKKSDSPRDAPDIPLNSARFRRR